jgi:tRNA-dihydrouridine synthase
MAIDKPFILKNKSIKPPLFLAPMAGLSHSAFRRLLSDFGGYGALYTEMLSARALLVEDLNQSPFTKRRIQEGSVLYQLKLSGEEQIDKVIERLSTLEPFGIDLNLGCPAPEVKKDGGGKALFDNIENLRRVLDTLRLCWDGILTVKCRLGNNTPGWEERFFERVKLFEEYKIDALCVHPRFSDEKLKREARMHLFPWIRSLTKLPLIANGDIAGTSSLKLLSANSCDALMIGRMAVVKPWIFQEFCGNSTDIDYYEVWNRHIEYICEDFSSEKAIGRIKEFSTWYSHNFFFGHEFYRLIQAAHDINSLRQKAGEFLKSDPQVSRK